MEIDNMYLGAHIDPANSDDLEFSYPARMSSNFGFNYHPCEQRHYYINVHNSGKKPAFWAQGPPLWNKAGFFDSDGVAFEQIMQEANLSKSVCNDYQKRIDNIKQKFKIGVGLGGVVGLALVGLVIWKILD